MELFTQPDSIVRKIWGNSDTVLFIFGGAAAEFALNKAVDWLYYTRKLPADPIGRLFSTVTYAHKIIFAEKQQAYAAISKIAAIHAGIEGSRGSVIPDWAYRDVLFMLIYYSIAAYELLEKKLSGVEKEEVVGIFYEVGIRMGLKEVPANYADWSIARQRHLEHDLVKSEYTIDLFRQYKKHLGRFRYFLLTGAQAALVPDHVKRLLGFTPSLWFASALNLYKRLRNHRTGKLLRIILLPSSYQAQIAALNIKTD